MFAVFPQLTVDVWISLDDGFESAPRLLRPIRVSLTCQPDVGSSFRAFVCLLPFPHPNMSI